MTDQPVIRTSNGSNDLVWKVCESIRDSFSHCEKCPAEIDSPYGKGKQGCRLHAEEVIALVRGSSETSEQLTVYTPCEKHMGLTFHATVGYGVSPKVICPFCLPAQPLSVAEAVDEARGRIPDSELTPCDCAPSTQKATEHA